MTYTGVFAASENCSDIELKFDGDAASPLHTMSALQLPSRSKQLIAEVSKLAGQIEAVLTGGASSGPSITVNRPIPTIEFV